MLRVRHALGAGLLLVSALVIIDGNELGGFWRNFADVSLGIRRPSADDDSVRLKLTFEEKPRTEGEFVAQYSVNGGRDVPVWLTGSGERGRVSSVVLTLKRTDRVITHIYRSANRTSWIRCAIYEVDTGELRDENERADDVGSVRCYSYGR